MAGADLYDTELRDQPWRSQEAGLGVVCSQTFSATVQAEEGIQKTSVVTDEFPGEYFPIFTLRHSILSRVFCRSRSLCFV